MFKSKFLAPFSEPFNHLSKWIEYYEKHGVIDSNAMALSTATQDGFPSSRMVLLKSLNEKGPVFYTNMESRKGSEIKENPNAALLFYWRKPGRQVRLEGKLEVVSDAEADEYFQSRPYTSRIGAWASKQSRPLKDRNTLEKDVIKWGLKFTSSQVERPPYWTGYRLAVQYFEFWEAGKFRLHKRKIYEKHENEWKVSYLYP